MNTYLKKATGYLMLLCGICMIYSCTSEKKGALMSILRAQQQSSFSQKMYQRTKPFLLDKYFDNIPATNSKYAGTTLHNEGVFYNQQRDTLYFLFTMESWADKDSVNLKNAAEKAAVTRGFSATLKNESLTYFYTCSDRILIKEGDLDDELYTKAYREQVIDKFADFIFEDKDIGHIGCFEGQPRKELYPVKFFEKLYKEKMSEKRE